jgi:hypothetical protein
VHFIESVKLVQVDIWHCYSATKITFKDDACVVFNNLINFQSEALPLLWVVNLVCLNNDFIWCSFHVGI